MLKEMKSQRFFVLTAVLAAVLLAGCDDKATDSAVPVPDNIRPETLAQVVASIELVPLQTTDQLLGGSVNVTPDSGDGWIVYDTQNGIIHHYDAAGKFLGRIGLPGRGPQEFERANHVQVRDGLLYVFSLGSSELVVYREDGSFVRREETGAPGSNGALAVDEGHLVYSGYAYEGDNLVKLVAADGSLTEFIPKKNPKMLSLFGAPVFSDAGDQVFVIPEWGDTVYRYAGGQVEPAHRFDLGRAALDDAFWQQADPASALMARMESSIAAFVSYYWENEQLRAVGVMFSSTDHSGQRNGLCYGVERRGKWSWFELLHDNALVVEVQCIEGDALVCLVDPALLDTLDPALREKIVNPQVLDGVTEDSNYLLAKLHIK